MSMPDIVSSATGRRKTAVAHVELVRGTGKIAVNHREFEQYFPDEAIRDYLIQPLKLVNLLGSFDGRAFVKGGGSTGQAGAVRHAIARALVASDSELRKTLKDQGCLTRDPRMKERKKPGQPGARRRFQFSKR
jgi:small subunit ribosomal protein S9